MSAPHLDDDFCFREIVEQLDLEAFVPEPAIEKFIYAGFADAVLNVGAFA